MARISKPTEFKKCSKCSLVKKYNVFRKKKDKLGWTDVNGEIRYSHCKKCESSSMRLRYKISPIPQMLSNSRIRAKTKGLEHNINGEYLKLIWPKSLNLWKSGNSF